MSTLIYVISGYLGSGKTTLINNILESAPPDLRIMVLVNEFGNVSVDCKLIKADPLNVVDLSGGCVCCGMFTELMASLRFALDTLRADIILIEGTGLAIPREIARQALTPVFEGRIEFGGIITVVDAGSLLSEESPILWRQIEEANAIVVNKIDLIDSKSLMEARSRLQSVTPSTCVVFETSFGKVEYDEIFSRRYDAGRMNSRSDKPLSGKLDSTAGFAAVCFVRNSPVLEEALLQLYQKHRHKIVRSKGFIVTEKGGLELQLSRAGFEVKAVEKTIRRTELVLIVREEYKEFIEREFEKVLETKISLTASTTHATK